MSFPKRELDCQIALQLFDAKILISGCGIFINMPVDPYYNNSIQCKPEEFCKYEKARYWNAWVPHFTENYQDVIYKLKTKYPEFRISINKTKTTVTIKNKLKRFEVKNSDIGVAVCLAVLKAISWTKNGKSEKIVEETEKALRIDGGYLNFAYDFVLDCIKTGYDPQKDGHRVMYWLVDYIGKLIVGKDDSKTTKDS